MFRWAKIVILACCALFALLSIPEPLPSIGAERPKTFEWNRKAYFHALKKRFDREKASGCIHVEGSLDELARHLSTFDEAGPINAADKRWDSLSTRLFQTAAEVAACPRHAPRFFSLSKQVRPLVKDQSMKWDIENPATRERIYTLLYGLRAASEEVLMQQPANERQTLFEEVAERSSTPSIDFHGVTVHSGDILISRGGAPTSALKIGRAHV